MGRKVLVKNQRNYETISIREKTFTSDFEIVKRFFDFRVKNVWNNS